MKGDVCSSLCTICSRKVSCAHQGRRDVERHIEQAIHPKNMRAAQSQSTLQFQPVSGLLNEKVHYIYIYIYNLFTIMHNTFDAGPLLYIF